MGTRCAGNRAEQDAANTLMDGSARPARASSTLSDIADEIQQGLATASICVAAFEQGPQDATPILGSPLYGQWHARQHTIAPTNPAQREPA